MFSSINTALSGLEQFQQDINVIGNNIANVNTTGYKDSRANFQDSLGLAIDASDPSSQVGSGVSTASVETNFNQGVINSTGIPSDLAINGGGFFVVKNTTTGDQYVTRAGDFTVDSSGYLIDSNGNRVQGYSDSGLSTIGDIKVDATGAPSTATPGATVSSYSINSQGDVEVTLSDGTTFARGQVLLQNFADPNALVGMGNNLYAITPNAGPLSQLTAPGNSGLGSIQSGALEGSNVDLTGEMTGLITAQNAYEANSKVVTTSDEVLQSLINLIR